MTTLELRLLGGFEALDSAGRALDIGPRKARAVLAYLACRRGQALPREQLSGLVWGDVSAGEQARRSLRQALTVLRRALPEAALETRRDSVALHLGVEVDVAGFERLAEQGDERSLERAFALYRGELLEGFAACADAFDGWLARERQRVAQRAADAMQRLCEMQRTRGDAQVAMTTAMRLVATDPLREPAHRALMELYAEAGRASEALRQYQALSALLAEKLGTKPDAQTAALAERIQLAATRRQVAVPTPLRASGELPELRQVCVTALAFAEQLEGAIEREAELVLARYGGMLLRVSQGSALGVFGLPRAHDNDHERALRASLALCTRLAQAGAHLAVGVAAGQVLVEHVAGRPVVRGEVLGRARALSQGRAEGVFVAGSLARALGSRLESAVGENATFESCRVLALRASRETPPRAPLVGREYELAQLAIALDLCVRTGAGRTIVLHGEAGMGKSRLVQALGEAARERGIAVHTHGFVDFGGAAEESPIVAIVRELLDGVTRGAPEPIAGTSVPPLERDELGCLLAMVREVVSGDGESDPRARELLLNQRRHATSRLLEVESRNGPHLLCVEDIHWADPEGLSHLRAWMEVAARCPLILLVTTRPEGRDDVAFRSALRGAAVTTLGLAPLSPSESRSLIHALSEASPVAEKLMPPELEAIEARAGGNPLFIEQLMTARPTQHVPTSIRSLVQARSDALDPWARELLQAASVLGQHFTPQALAYLLDVEALDLTSLVRRAWIVEQADGYRFVHALVRDAIYAGLPEARRSLLHASAARHYAGRDLSLHAQHLERAGDSAAASAFLRAAAQERRAGNLERALALATRGKALATLPRERDAAALYAGELHNELGRPEEGLSLFARTEARSADARVKAEAALGRAAALRLLDRSKEALTALVRAERLIDPSKDAALWSRLHYLRGNVLFPLGDADACLRAQTLALEAARRAGSSLAEAQALSGVADAHFAAGRYRAARDCFGRCEALARRIGALDLELASRAMHCMLDMYDLAFEEGTCGLVEVAERAATAALLRTEALAQASLAWSLLLTGEWELALRAGRRTATIADQIGSRRFAALGIAYAALAQAGMGDTAAARAELHRALALAQSSSIGFAGCAVYAALLTTAPEAQRASLLAEAERLLRTLPMSFALVVLVQHAMQAAFALGDVPRVLSYVAMLEASMRDDPHTLGMLLVRAGRAVASGCDPGASRCDAAALAQLREELERAGMRPLLAWLENAHPSPRG